MNAELPNLKPERRSGAAPALWQWLPACYAKRDSFNSMFGVQVSAFGVRVSIPAFGVQCGRTA